MDKAVQPAPARKGVYYERRRPEETVLYQLVQEHLETFLAQVERETGSGLPEFVKDEFDAFLQCGILAHGFLRLRCADCAHEKLVAFGGNSRATCGPWRNSALDCLTICAIHLRSLAGNIEKFTTSEVLLQVGSPRPTP